MNQGLNPTRRGFLLCSTALLASCALKPVSFDRSSLAGVTRVQVPTPGFPPSPTVDVTAGIGKSLGAIGLISTAIVMGNRSTALQGIMAANGLNPADCFARQLHTKLGEIGFAPVPEPANADRRHFLAQYGAASPPSAVLDVWVASYGLIAYSDSDQTPYYPAVELSVRLISARDQSVLMADHLAFPGIDAPLPQPEGPPAVMAFTTFGEVTANPGRATAAMRAGLQYAVDAIGRRLV